MVTSKKGSVSMVTSPTNVPLLCLKIIIKLLIIEEYLVIYWDRRMKDHITQCDMLHYHLEIIS